jgi:hypothetical protein
MTENNSFETASQIKKMIIKVIGWKITTIKLEFIEVPINMIIYFNVEICIKEYLIKFMLTVR